MKKKPSSRTTGSTIIQREREIYQKILKVGSAARAPRQAGSRERERQTGRQKVAEHASGARRKQGGPVGREEEENKAK